MKGVPRAAPWHVCLALLLGAAIWQAAADPRPEPPSGGPERLKQNTRITVDTNAQPAATTSPKPKKAFHLDASWLGWDGLHLELNQRTTLTNPSDPLRQLLAATNSVPQINIEQVQMTATLGGRLEVDGAAFLTTGNLTGFDDGFQVRRALFSMRGDCILLFPVSYRIELGYRPNQFYLDEAYLLSADISYIGNLQFGFFSPPMGLELITSSRDMMFMEPAAPLQAMGPPKESGIQIGHPVLNQHVTWALGIFGDAATDTEYGNSSRNYGTAMGRLTWLTMGHLDPGDPAANRYLHLGLSGSYQYSATSTIRYKSRPESYLAPDVIDTGDIDASGAGTIAAEAAWVNGPLCLQGEFIQAFVQGTNSSPLRFSGCYGQASWYLTGESRPYDPATGAFARLIPRRNFNFGKGGAWGALELACRFSHTDLDDAQIKGGRLNLLMIGVNWYLNPHLRWMFNSGVGRVFGGVNDGDMFMFQTRIGVDF
jgi:phosphate-selective porin OprO/OprP